VYNEDPVEQARIWAAGGAEWLHVVDLDGARDGVPRNIDVIRAHRARSGRSRADRWRHPHRWTRSTGSTTRE
jgi:hypothetical protein